MRRLSAGFHPDDPIHSIHDHVPGPLQPLEEAPMHVSHGLTSGDKGGLGRCDNCLLISLWQPT